MKIPSDCKASARCSRRMRCRECKRDKKRARAKEGRSRCRYETTLVLSCPPPQGASRNSFKEQRKRTVKHEKEARASKALPPALPVWGDYADMAYVTFLYGNNETEFPKKIASIFSQPRLV